MSGLKFEDGTCFFNKAAGPGGCVQPCPELVPANEATWELWDQTWEAGNFRGMDGDPVGRHFCCVESVARALDVPWDRHTLIGFKLILGAWLESAYKAKKERKPKGK